MLANESAINQALIILFKDMHVPDDSLHARAVLDSSLDSQLSADLIDESLDLLDRTTSFLERVLQQRAADLKRRRNMLVPSIHRLPSELLTHIIHLLVDDIDHARVDRVLQLQVVCKRWWQLIQSTPTLWTMLEPEGPYNLALQKTANAPLIITDGVLKEIPIATLQRYLLAVCARSSRWHTISTAQGFDLLIPNLNQASSCLTKIDFRNIGNATYPCIDLQPHTCLRHVRVHNISLVWDPPGFRQLRSLEVVGTPIEHIPTLMTLLEVLRECQELENFSLEGGNRWGDGRDRELLVGWPDDAKTLENTVFLPKLRELVIRNIAPSVFQIVLTLKTPPLSKLILDTNYIKAASSVLPSLTRPFTPDSMLYNLLGQGQAKIWILNNFFYITENDADTPWTQENDGRKLYVAVPGYRDQFSKTCQTIHELPFTEHDIPLLMGVWCSGDDWDEVRLHDLPTLKSLQVRVQPQFLPQVFRYLSRPISTASGSRSVPCPRLEELRIADPAWAESAQVAEMLRSRAQFASEEASGAPAVPELRVMDARCRTFDLTSTSWL